MQQFTYTPPTEKSFLECLSYYLKKRGYSELDEVLQKAHVDYRFEGQGYRIGSMRTVIIFRLPLPLIEQAEEKLWSGQVSANLIEDSMDCIPFDSGMDVVDFTFAPLLEINTNEKILEDTIQSIENLSNNEQDKLYPVDIRKKMIEMNPFYSALYIIENLLRIFVLNVITENFGTDNLKNIVTNKDQKDKINTRKRLEAGNKWMRPRGESDIFYLDFSDFAFIIENNWSLFKPYFSNCPWIKVKLGELSEIRNVVAHTSYLGDTEKKLLRINFQQIIAQIKHKIEP